MMRSESRVLQVNLDDDEFHNTVRNSLRQRPRAIPPKFFYDARGSELFDLICTTPEYYLTRTETGILDVFGADMAGRIGASCVLIELGSGSASKTPLLLRHLADDAAYVPIDIYEPHLLQSTQRLSMLFPEMHMHPLCADYTRLPSVNLDGYAGRRRVIFFPGSSIGNCIPDEAVQLLRHAAQLVGANGAMLIGVDSKKPARRAECRLQRCRWLYCGIQSEFAGAHAARTRRTNRSGWLCSLRLLQRGAGTDRDASGQPEEADH